MRCLAQRLQQGRLYGTKLYIEGIRISELKVSYWHRPSPASHRNFRCSDSRPYGSTLFGVLNHVVVYVVHTWPEPDPETGVEVGRIIGARKATAQKGGPMKKRSSDRLTPAQQAEIDALAALPDDQIDTRDLPEVRDWSGARRGMFFGPSSSSSRCGSTPT